MHNRRLLTRSFHNWKESKFYYKSIIIDTTDTKADLFYLWKTVAMEENLRKEEECYTNEEFNFLLY